MITVIVPVYNTEKYLDQCIQSVLTQTYTNWELLLIDDGSTDSSSAICDKYMAQDSRIRVFHKENGGVSSARNLGLDNAMGDWVTFIDADDWIENDTFEKLHHRIIEDCADICCYDCKILYAHREAYIYTPSLTIDKYEYLKRWLEFELTSLCLILARRSIYEVNNLRCPNQDYCEDFHLSTRLLYYANKITKLNYIGYIYNRLNENSMVNNISEKSAKDELVIYKSVLDFFARNCVLDQFEEKVVWRILKCTQHLILDSSRHREFQDAVPSRYKRYIFSAPPHFVNLKVKIMAWLLCNRLSVIVKMINMLRGVLKR